ncbi:hypothetical protein QBC39DRAFT_148528 [Podospora conica]|nr:hypothetical protein QBC39DRAFT_148528 [Schizothecium conicum]
MGSPHDENLPEVVLTRNVEADPKSPPQVVTGRLITDQHWQEADKEKFHVSYDTAPKFPDDNDYVSTWKSSEPELSTASTQSGHPPWESLPAGDDTAADAGEPEKGNRICGVRRRTFIMSLVVAILVIAAAVGGGVGAALARKATAAPPMPPLFLNNGTAPAGIAFQAFTDPVFEGEATRVIQDEGFHDLNMTSTSYVWSPQDTKCCLTFCDGPTTDVGYWCNPRRRTHASLPFNRVYIWCGGNRNDQLNTTCS